MHLKDELISKIDKLSSDNEKWEVKVEINKLLESEEKYKLLAENSLDVIWQLDQKLRFTYVSPSLEKLTGYKPEDWIGTKLSEHTPPTEFVKMARYALRAFKSSKIKPQQTFLTKLICKDGSLLPVEIIGNVMKTKNGKPLGIQGSTRDITTRLLAERSLRESEERYGLALTAAQEGIWDWKLSDDTVFYSDQWKAQLGYEKDELTDEFATWQNLLHPVDYGRTHCELKKYIRDPKDRFFTTFRLRHKDGTYRWIQNRSAAIKDHAGKVVRMFGAHTDITNQVIAEQALRESEQKLKNVISGAQVILFSLDKNGVFTFSDGKGLESLGLNPGEVVGQSVFKVYKNHTGLLKLFRRALSGESVRAIVDVGDLFFDTSYAPIIGVSGNVESVIGVSSNVTDHIKMEKQLTELNKELQETKLKAEESDRLKSAFLANMSHEIRTPMNSILGFSDLLNECKADEQREEYVDIIQKNGEVLLTLLNDIIDLSKIEGGQFTVKPELVNIIDLMMELEQLYGVKLSQAGKPKLKINLEIPSGYQNLQLKTDRSRLFQVFANLLDNALKFTDEGLIVFGFYIEDSGLKFFVRDTGIGIKKDDLKIIFERFAQVRSTYDGKYGGAGLGLSISKKIVELLGGNLSVQSKYNKGSVFSFSLPLITASTKKSNYKKNVRIRKTRKKKDRTILIVEDEDSSKRLIETLLSPLNFKILSVATGEEALEICRNNKNVNLVLMDLKLPRMSGYEATTKIKNLNKNIHVIVQTALTFDHEKQKSFDCGCDDFLTKPIKTKRLINTINKYF